MATEKKTIHVAIIGPSGRDGQYEKQFKQPGTFGMMVNKARDHITKVLGFHPVEVTLVSGGAPWSDHVAVALYLSGGYAGLTLHLPCSWNSAKCEFNVTGRTASLNEYHRTFSAVSGCDSLGDIESAKKRGAKIMDHYYGYFDRNRAIANGCDRLLAFSWGRSVRPTSSGTAWTWDRVPSRVHKVTLCLE